MAALQWDEIDFNDNIIRIKPERMKMGDTHLVPLSSQVSLILHKLLSIKVNSKFVFPSPNGADRHISPESLRAGLRRMGLTKDEITTHGFRHMASTRLNELGYRSEVIEIQLAHKERNSVKAAYNHAEYLSDRREMMQFWSNYLDELKNTLINIT